MAIKTKTKTRKKPVSHKQAMKSVEVAQRRATISKLYLKGATQWEIAEKLGIDQSAVSKDLKALRDAWLEEGKDNFDRVKSEQLKRIDLIEEEAWKAWDRSCEPAETVTHREEEGGEDGLKTVKQKTLKGQCGDEKFLARVSWCVEQRLKIIGAFDNVSTGTTVVQINWSDMYASSSNRREQVNPVDTKLAELETVKVVHTDEQKEKAEEG